MQGAWRVGLLVIIFVGLLFGAYALLGKSFLAPKVNTYYADFADAAGTAQGTPVLMAGVRIGEVSKVDLASPKVARLTLAIEKKYGIPKGSTATIQTSLIGFGQQPVVIVPPSVAEPIMRPNSVIPGAHGTGLDAFLPDIKTTLSELNKTLVATRGFLEDEKLKGGVEKLLETSNKTVEQFGQIAQHANALLGDNQAKIQAAISNAAQAMTDIRKSTAIVAEFAKDPKWKQQSIGLLDKLNATSAKAENLMENLNAFVTDPKLRQPINQAVANTAKITDTGTRIADNTETITKNGIVMSQKAIEIEDKAKDLEDDARKVLDKLQSAFGFKKPSALLSGPVTGSIDFLRSTRPGHTRTDLNFTIPLQKENIHLGLYDAFESNKINAELGEKFGKNNEFLYGVYASKPGVGVDYQLARRLFLRGDLYDVNNPHLDLRARVEFGNGFYGWLGVDRLLKTNALVIGVGFRK
ncbi:MAG TPA: MlaD family protein [Fimbriimonadaceae bacterium]|jgi:phospholipid/cholesterol/gamma-HCH transport system substrate-binding protein